MSTLNVARDFSPFPAGRLVSDGSFPGERFRDLLVSALQKLGPTEQLKVQFDETLGYGLSFLEEAFGGLVRKCGFSAKKLHEKLIIETSDPSTITEVWSYIDTARAGE